MNEKLETVRQYYARGLWDARRVRNAVGRWITQAEADELLSQPQGEADFATDTPDREAEVG